MGYAQLSRIGLDDPGVTALVSAFDRERQPLLRMRRARARVAASARALAMKTSPNGVTLRASRLQSGTA